MPRRRPRQATRLRAAVETTRKAVTRISPEPRVTRMSSRRRDGRRYIRRARRRPWPAAAFRASAGTGRGRADLVEPGGGEAVLVAGRECGGQGGVQAGAVLRRLPPRASLCQRIRVSARSEYPGQDDRSIRARTIGVSEPGRSEYPSQEYPSHGHRPAVLLSPSLRQRPPPPPSSPSPTLNWRSAPRCANLAARDAAPQKSERRDGASDFRGGTISSFGPNPHGGEISSEPFPPTPAAT